MINQTQPIMAMELIQKYICCASVEEKLPEFDFIWELAKKVKARGCYCGLNHEIVKILPQFNETVENLSLESIKKISKILKRDKLCFGIVEKNQFRLKCYQD